METILFLIIAGILSSIFGKAKGKNNPGRKKPFTAKGFNDFRTQVEQQMLNIQSKPGQITTGQPPVLDNKVQSLEEKYQEIEQKPVVSTLQSNQNKPIESTIMKVESDDVPFERPEEKTIINGIIWGEILGKPRSKNPYFSRKS